jgi:hypothetical protein
MVQVPGQHAIMYAANVDGILACSTEHKDGCQMVQGLQTPLKNIFNYRAMGYFLADDGRKYIYSAGYARFSILQDSSLHQSNAFWFSV